MTGRRNAQFEKHVEIVAKQSDEQLVTGVVMRPDKVDLQGDYAEPEQIERFAEGFEALLENDDADGGIMHAAWPSEWMDLEANGIYPEVQTEEMDLPEDGVEAGDWIQTWRVNDSELYDLIADDVISGFSIGARDVSWRGPIEQADAPDHVEIPDEWDDDAPVWEITDGVIREVSVVDIPAVPDAQILSKEDAKALGDHLGNQEGFIEEATQRGHSEADAERLWDVLNRAVEVEDAGTPGKSLLERAGKAFLKAFSAESESDDATGAEHQTRTDADKEGRTLSKQNRESLYATIDASLDVLSDANAVPGDMQRFTDREDYDFDLSEHQARSWPKPDPDEDEDEDEQSEDNAGTSPGNSGTSPEASDDTTQHMSDTDDDPFADAPEWAKALRDEQDDKDADADSDMDDSTDTPEWAKALSETVEQNTEQIKSLMGEGGEDVWDDAPEWAKDLRENVEENASAIDTIGKQSGYSDQLEGGVDDDSEKDSALGEVSAALNGGA